MTAKHTPGPWEVRKVGGDFYVGAPSYEGHPYHERTTHIEIMSDEDYPTKESDAHLIAAAPDLLAALKYYRDECSGREPSISVFLRMMDEAIAKAEGGA